MISPELNTGDITIIANPKSSHPEKVESFAAIIQSAATGDVSVIETGDPREVDNEQLVADSIENGGLLIVNGGDGTVNIAVNGARRSGKSDLALFAVPCGNADDTSTSWHGKDYFDSEDNISDLLQNGVRTPLPLIRVDYEGTTRWAAAYWGMGLSGQAAVEMNRPEYRKAKETRPDPLNRMTDALKVLPLLLPRQDNIYEYASDGSTKPVREMLISSVNHFAREFIVDVDSWGEEVIVNEFGPEKFVRGILGRLGRERYRAEFVKALYEAKLTPEALRSALSGRPMSPGVVGQPFEAMTLELMQDTPVHFDGEPVALPAGAVLNISVEQGAINGLRPAAK